MIENSIIEANAQMNINNARLIVIQIMCLGLFAASLVFLFVNSYKQ